MTIKERILSFMTEQTYKPMIKKELGRILNINKNEMNAFEKLLIIMEKEGLIVKTGAEQYGIPEKMGLVIGLIQGHSKGYGFVTSEGKLHDVFIPAANFNGAMHKDKVLVKIIREEEGGKKCEGEVVSVLERGNKTIIGTFQSSANFGFVVPEDKRVNVDVFIAKGEANGAKNGQIVVAEVTLWPEKKKNPEGKIIEILGNKGDKGIDILTIIRKHGLPEEFTEKVKKYTESIKDTISEDEIKGRTDFRDSKIITIDGEDAKDLDDAVNVELLSNGNYRLGVHIADVSHYVRDKSALDKEALKRGTSVYLIDRVIPMLPRKLSNGICSLNPKVDRLTLSCVMEIDSSGRVVDHTICESVIRSTERMTYTDVTNLLSKEDPELINRYGYLLENFKNMEALSKILNKKRTVRGAIDFDFAESKIILDDLGKPIEVKPNERGIANRIIEEFMLVCNETIAEHMFWAYMPFVYRIHEEPKAEKLEHFNDFAHNLGYVIHYNQEVHPKELQAIIEQTKGKKEEVVISTLLLRSMMQARYSPVCSGHFGLAAKYYCHFTSPIRRYPDLIIHRIIKEFINGRLNESRMKRLTTDVEYASVQSSETERQAQDAEMEVDKLKKAEYMSYRIGESFEGVISSVTSFGFFVELPSTIEGLVHMSSLHDDFYIFDEKYLTLIGERTKKTFRLGDPIKIKVDRVDLEAYEVYFEVIDNADDDIDQ